MKLNFVFKVRDQIKVSFDGLTELFDMVLSNAVALKSNIAMSLTKYWRMAKKHQSTWKQAVYLKAQKPLQNVRQRIFIEAKVKEQAKKDISDSKEAKVIYISNVSDDMTKYADPDRSSLTFIEYLSLLRIVRTALQNAFSFKALAVNLDELKGFGILKAAQSWRTEAAAAVTKKLHSCKSKVTFSPYIFMVKSFKERSHDLFAIKTYPVFVELLHLARLKAHDNKQLCAMDSLTLDKLEKIKL